jgi:hypothetical protein
MILQHRAVIAGACCGSCQGHESPTEGRRRLCRSMGSTSEVHISKEPTSKARISGPISKVRISKGPTSGTPDQPGGAHGVQTAVATDRRPDGAPKMAQTASGGRCRQRHGCGAEPDGLGRPRSSVPGGAAVRSNRRPDCPGDGQTARTMAHPPTRIAVRGWGHLAVHPRSAPTPGGRGSSLGAVRIWRTTRCRSGLKLQAGPLATIDCPTRWKSPNRPDFHSLRD